MGQPLPPDLATPPTQTAQPVTIVNQPPAGQYFTAEQLEAARQQEKDKLYAKMQSLEESFKTAQADLDQYKTERQAALDAQRQAEEAAAEAERKVEEEKLSVTQLLDRRTQELQQQQEEFQRQMELQRTVMERDQQLFQLQTHIQRRITEELAANTILEDLVEYIDGNTLEEVEASITKAKEKTAKIFEGAQRLNAPQSITPGVSPTGFAPTGPLDNLAGTESYTPEQIKAMSNAEYAEFRAKVGVDKAGNNKGLFN